MLVGVDLLGTASVDTVLVHSVQRGTASEDAALVPVGAVGLASVEDVLADDEQPGAAFAGSDLVGGGTADTALVGAGQDELASVELVLLVHSFADAAHAESDLAEFEPAETEFVGSASAGLVLAAADSVVVPVELASVVQNKTDSDAEHGHFALVLDDLAASVGLSDAALPVLALADSESVELAFVGAYNAPERSVESFVDSGSLA